jgi:uncharacterized protein YeaO (DUF488 family)
MRKMKSKRKTTSKKSTARPRELASSKTRSAGPTIRIKRAYDPPSSNDGLRILIDRLWPRGLSKDKLKIDAWVKHLSPSNELRKWYRHDPDKFDEFHRRYLAELKQQDEGLDELRAAVAGRTVTLLTATKELDLSHATVLRELLTRSRRS